MEHIFLTRLEDKQHLEFSPSEQRCNKVALSPGKMRNAQGSVNCSSVINQHHCNRSYFPLLLPPASKRWCLVMLHGQPSLVTVLPLHITQTIALL